MGAILAVTKTGGKSARQVIQLATDLHVVTAQVALTSWYDPVNSNSICFVRWTDDNLSSCLMQSQCCLL